MHDPKVKQHNQNHRQQQHIKQGNLTPSQITIAFTMTKPLPKYSAPLKRQHKPRIKTRTKLLPTVINKQNKPL